MILHWSVLVNSPYCSLYHNNTINTTTVCHVLPFDIILLYANPFLPASVNHNQGAAAGYNPVKQF